MKRVYVIILNWNGWQDTIESLESVFRLDYPDFRVIVCDNASQDGSLEQIKAWACGDVVVTMPEENMLRRLSSPPVHKPVPFVEYDRRQAEQGGDPSDGNVPLVLVRTGGNLGFAGGNNVGLRYALARNDFEYVWLLNNDTVVEMDALSRMVERMSARPQAGICGATLLHYHEPEVIQTLGGATYNRWIGASRLIGLFQPAGKPVDVEDIERRMSFVAGACMLVTRAFLHDIGLLCEDYFLYYEELDWIQRARGRYILAYASAARIYHKIGASIHANTRDLDKKSRLSDYYHIRNRLVIAARFYPATLPTVYLGLVVTALNRIRRRQWDRLPFILPLALGMRHRTSEDAARWPHCPPAHDGRLGRPRRQDMLRKKEVKMNQRMHNMNGCLMSILSGAEYGVRMGNKDMQHIANRFAASNYLRVSRTLASEVPDGKVLDWGCGYGQVTLLLRTAGMEVEPYEIEARPNAKVIPPFCDVGITYGEADKPLPYAESSFDVVLSCGTLEHVRSQDESLLELRRVLKDDGRLYVYMLPSKHSYTELLADMLHRSCHPVKFTPKTATDMLERACFRVERIRRANALPHNLTGLPYHIAELYGHLAGILIPLDRAISSLPLINRFCGVIEIVATRKP